MRKIILFFIIGLSLQGFAQLAPNKYLVRFSDKNQSPYSLSQPEAFLSQRALDRRASQGIAVDVTDIPIDPAFIEDVVATGAKLIIQVKWNNAIIIETESTAVLEAINNLEYVLNVQQINKRISNKKSIIDKFEVENSASYKARKSDPVYGDAYNQINMVNGIPLHEDGYKGEGMVIAVLDAGFINTNIRTIFSSLWNNNQILGSYNFVNPSEDVFRYHSHGTLVLSVMGGSLPGTFLGTAPKANYWLLVTEESGSEFIIEEYNWIAGAAFADSVGADVITSSLGYYDFDNATYNHAWADLDGNTTPVTKAADLAASKGIIVVNSAGNEGDKTWKYLIAPADGDSVFTIGAVYANELITNFSSYGFEWDSRVKPNVVAQGGSTVLANYTADVLTTANGTSFSAPLVAGMMACLWQTHPDLNNMDIIRAVEQSASKYSNPDNRYGYGIPDFANAKLILGLSDLTNPQNSVKIAPNPVSNSTLIQWNQEDQNFEWLELIDLKGRILYRVRIENNEDQFRLSLEGYKSGIYFLRLGNQFQRLNKKIIKID